MVRRQIVCQQIWNKPECFVKAAEFIEQSGPWVVRQWLPLKIEETAAREYKTATEMVCEICYGLVDMLIDQPELQSQLSDYCEHKNYRQIEQDWILRRS